MNYLHLTKAVIGFYFFMKRQTANYGAPVDLSDAECQEVFEGIKQNRFSIYNYYFALNICTMKLIFTHNIERFFPDKKNFNLDSTFRAIHPDFLVENIQWAETTFRYVTTELKLTEGFKPLKQFYHIPVPIKLLDGNYHWMMTECSPLQLDKNKNVITVLMSYSLMRPFIKGEKVPVIGTLYDENFEKKELNQAFFKTYFIRKPFVLTVEQNKIIELLVENNNLTNTEIAEKLGKKKNTIDIQNKQILERARTSFPTEHFESVRDVVEFMKAMKFFDDDHLTSNPSW